MWQRATHYIYNLAAWQEPREDVLRSSLAVPCLCACCVWSRCLILWPPLFQLTEHTKQQIAIQAATFSAILSLLHHQHFWCCHSMCLLYLPVVPCFSCTLIFSWVSTKVQAPSSLLNVQHLVWLLSLFGTVGLDVWAWWSFLCPFPSVKTGTMTSLSWDIFGWQCPNMQCIVQFTWLCFLPQKLTKSIPCFLPVRKLYSAFISHSGDRLCDRDD